MAKSMFIGRPFLLPSWEAGGIWLGGDCGHRVASLPAALGTRGAVHGDPFRALSLSTLPAGWRAKVLTQEG